MPDEDEPKLDLRRPGWLFAALGVLILFVIGAVLSVGAVPAFQDFNPEIVTGLMWPTSIGAGLAAGNIGGRLRRWGFVTRREVVGRAAAAGAAAGFAWPFSFIVFPLFEGAVEVFVDQLPAVGICTLFGAAVGALGAWIASYAVLRKI